MSLKCRIDKVMRIGKFDTNLDPDPESCSARLVNSNSKKCHSTTSLH